MNTEVSCCHTVKINGLHYYVRSVPVFAVCFLLQKLAVFIQILIERQIKNGRVFLCL
jgi:hypothetical protein